MRITISEKTLLEYGFIKSKTEEGWFTLEMKIPCGYDFHPDDGKLIPVLQNPVIPCDRRYYGIFDIQKLMRQINNDYTSKIHPDVYTPETFKNEIVSESEKLSILEKDLKEVGKILDWSPGLLKRTQLEWIPQSLQQIRKHNWFHKFVASILP